eukprot:jgi/Chrzof1/8988/Cz03g32010.t1
MFIELVCKPWAAVAQQMPCTKQLHLRAPEGQQQARAAMGWLFRHRRAILQHVTTTSAWILRSLSVCDVERLHLTCSEADGTWDVDHPNLQWLQLTVSGDVAFNLGSLPGLQYLSLRLGDWTRAASFPTLPASLQHLDGLQSLHISPPSKHCSGSQSLEPPLCLRPLQQLTGLKKLELRECRGISDLRPLQHLTDLETLDLRMCEGISNLQPLQHLTSLQTLDLCCMEQDISNGGITDLQPLQYMARLKTLDLSGNVGITDVRPLQHLTALQKLNLSGIDGMDLWPLQHLTGLQTLDIIS